MSCNYAIFEKIGKSLEIPTFIYLLRMSFYPLTTIKLLSTMDSKSQKLTKYGEIWKECEKEKLIKYKKLLQDERKLKISIH